MSMKYVRQHLQCYSDMCVRVCMSMQHVRQHLQHYSDMCVCVCPCVRSKLIYNALVAMNLLNKGCVATPAAN
jgi:hypothetical protein